MIEISTFMFGYEKLHDIFYRFLNGQTDFWFGNYATSNTS